MLPGANVPVVFIRATLCQQGAKLNAPDPVTEFPVMGTAGSSLKAVRDSSTTGAESAAGRLTSPEYGLLHVLEIRQVVGDSRLSG